MEPKHSVSIELHTTTSSWLSIIFAEKPSQKVVQSLEDFVSRHEGFSLTRMPDLLGKPYWLSLNPLYEPKDVCIEIEKILKSYYPKMFSILSIGYESFDSYYPE